MFSHYLYEMRIFYHISILMGLLPPSSLKRINYHTTFIQCELDGEENGISIWPFIYYRSNSFPSYCGVLVDVLVVNSIEQVDARK